MLKTVFTSLMALVFVAISFSSPAFAQSKKEMIAKDIQLEQRIGALEGRFLTGDPAAERLMQRMDSLEAAQRALTGEIEQIRYERETLQAEVSALTGELSAYKSAPVMAAPSGAVIYEPAPAPTYENQPYETLPPVLSPTMTEPEPFPQGQSGTMGSAVVDMAELQTIGQEKLLSGDFSGAQLAFKQYIDLNPNAPDVGNAYFWLGETYYVKSGFAEAAEAYIASMRAAPEGEKAPSAMIGLAGALRGMGNQDGACQTLASFPMQFPSASADMKFKADRERQRAGCS
ncbi:MAG: hypothetical protein V3U82_08945 [Robiginitomaculum sp.]